MLENTNIVLPPSMRGNATVIECVNQLGDGVGEHAWTQRKSVVVERMRHV